MSAYGGGRKDFLKSNTLSLFCSGGYEMLCHIVSQSPPSLANVYPHYCQAD